MNAKLVLAILTTAFSMQSFAEGGMHIIECMESPALKGVRIEIPGASPTSMDDPASLEIAVYELEPYKKTVTDLAANGLIVDYNFLEISSGVFELDKIKVCYGRAGNFEMLHDREAGVTRVTSDLLAYPIAASTEMKCTAIYQPKEEVVVEE